jgi:hydroxymethylbilane synthase
MLAYAGVKRMGWESRISERLEPSAFPHAVGQGALGLECRRNDEFIIELLRPLLHDSTWLTCLAERSCLNALEGSCSSPIGMVTRLEKERLELSVWVLTEDGKECKKAQESVALSCLDIQPDALDSSSQTAIALGKRVAALFSS